MKTKLLCMCVLACIGILRADAQFRWGAEAGVNMSSLGVKSNSISVYYTGGVTADYVFKNQIMLQSGLHYTMKGAKSIATHSQNYELMTRLGYLELPIMVGYRLPLADHIYLVPSVGAYFAYGINGYAEIGSNSFHTNWNGTDGVWENPFKDFNSNGVKVNAFERFDSGLRFALSTEVYKFNLSLGYELGLKKTWTGFSGMEEFTTSTYKLKNRSASITLGYRF